MSENIEQFTFENGMQELEQLVQSLESGQLALENSFVEAAAEASPEEEKKEP